MREFVGRVREIQWRHGAEAMAVAATGRLTLEESLLLTLLCRFGWGLTFVSDAASPGLKEVTSDLRRAGHQAMTHDGKRGPEPACWLCWSSLHRRWEIGAGRPARRTEPRRAVAGAAVGAPTATARWGVDLQGAGAAMPGALTAALATLPLPCLPDNGSRSTVRQQEIPLRGCDPAAISSWLFQSSLGLFEPAGLLPEPLLQGIGPRLPQPLMHGVISTRELNERLGTGAITGLWVIGGETRDWSSALGLDQSRLQALEFLVLQETLTSAEATAQADLVLPSALHREKDGLELLSPHRGRRLVSRREPPAWSQTDFEILSMIAGYGGQTALTERCASPAAVGRLLRVLSEQTAWDLGRVWTANERSGLGWTSAQSGPATAAASPSLTAAPPVDP